MTEVFLLRRFPLRLHGGLKRGIKIFAVHEADDRAPLGGVETRCDRVADVRRKALGTGERPAHREMRDMSGCRPAPGGGGPPPRPFLRDRRVDAYPPLMNRWLDN